MTPVRAQSSVVDAETLGVTILTWARKYCAVWLGVSGMLVLVAAGIWYMGHRKQIVLADLRAGIVELQGGGTEKAITYLERVRRASSIGSEAQAIGVFYLADAYVKGGRKEDAKEAYQEALTLTKSSAGKTGYLQQMILIKLAQDAVQRGDQVQARQWYEQAAEIEAPFQSEALAQVVRVLEKMDGPSALTYFEKLRTKGESYPLTEVLKERVGK